MTETILLNIDNLEFESDQMFDLVYADMIYESTDFRWIHKYWHLLKDGGIFIVQTDHHTVHRVWVYIEDVFQQYNELINHLTWKNEWGNHPKDRFHQCFDDILVFKKGNKAIKHRFYSDRVQIDKVTKNKGLNPSGRQTKTATAFISDIALTTTSKERVKKNDGHLIRWQKPLSLMQRLIDPFTDVGDWVLEPFGGTFPACRWSKMNGRNSVGIELDKYVFELGKEEVDKT